jgi:hypothetical protein
MNTVLLRYAVPSCRSPAFPVEKLHAILAQDPR